MSYARAIDAARKDLSLAIMQRDHIGAKTASDRLAQLQFDSKRDNAEKLAIGSVNAGAREHWANETAKYARIWSIDKPVHSQFYNLRLLLVSR